MKQLALFICLTVVVVVLSGCSEKKPAGPPPDASPAGESRDAK